MPPWAVVENLAIQRFARVPAHSLRAHQCVVEFESSTNTGVAAGRAVAEITPGDISVRRDNAGAHGCGEPCGKAA